MEVDPKDMRLGRRPPSNKPALMLGKYLLGSVTQIPTHPILSDNLSGVSDFGLYQNDKFGVCGPTAVANSRKLVTKFLTPSEQSPTQDDVFDLYRRSGNPNFDPTSDFDDDGVDIQTMLNEVVSNGIGGVKALAFAKLNVVDVEEVNAALAIFGFLIYGVNLQMSQREQHTIWDYRPSDEWGGHAVLGGSYTPTVHGVITWGQTVALTTNFYTNQLEEAWVVIWPEHLNQKWFVNNLNLSEFARDYESITGKPFPVPLPPSSVPVADSVPPVPNTSDQVPATPPVTKSESLS